MGIVKRNAMPCCPDAFHDLALPQCFGGSFAVRFNQAPDAKFGSPKVSDHSEQDVGQFVGADDSEDRWTCAVVWLAIVT